MEVCLSLRLYYLQCAILSLGQDSLASEKSPPERVHDIQPECVSFFLSLSACPLQQACVIILLSM